MNARDRKNTKESNRIIRHSSYSDSPKSHRINPSVSDPNLTPKKSPNIEVRPQSVANSEIPKDDVYRPLHEELSFLMVVCPNLNKEMVFNQVWFYFEFISKSITEAMIVHETKQPITDRCSEYICSLVGLLTTEICNRFFNEFERVCRFNSALAFFVRDLIGVLPRARVLNFIKIYSDLTNEAIRGNIGVCDQLKLLRARFLRLIVFHDGFLDLLSGMDSDGEFPADDPLFFIFNDIDYLLNTFKGKVFKVKTIRYFF